MRSVLHVCPGLTSSLGHDSRDHCLGKLLLLFGLWVPTPAEISRCSSRHSFLARCLMARHVSLVLINRSAKLVEPCLQFGFNACGCHPREAHWRRCPTGTAHDSPVCEAFCRVSLCFELSAHQGRFRLQRSRHSCREAWCKGFGVSNCPLVVVALRIPSSHSSCSRADPPLDLWISSLYAPSRKNRQVHITNASCYFLPLTSAGELV